MASWCIRTRTIYAYHPYVLRFTFHTSPPRSIGYHQDLLQGVELGQGVGFGLLLGGYVALAHAVYLPGDQALGEHPAHAGCEQYVSTVYLLVAGDMPH